MNPLSAAKNSFKQYATFYGRTNRSTYWNWIAFQAAVYVAMGMSFIAIGVVAGSTAQDNYDYSQSGQSTNWLATGIAGLSMVGLIGLAVLFYLACFVPNLATSARRLHDANFSAWFLLLYLIPYVGTVAIFIMHCFKSHPGVSFYENEGRPRGSYVSGSDQNNYNSSNSEW